MYVFKRNSTLSFEDVQSAGISNGMGDIFKVGSEVTKALKGWTIVARAGAHAIAQGALSYMQGGNFLSGALAGAFASVSNDLLGNWLNNHPDSKFLNGKGFALLTGAVSGGVGSVLGGGNFWMGEGQGLVVTAFNFLAHREVSPLNDGDGPGPKSKQVYKAPWDLNGDGILQKNEADNWWLTGKGADIWVDNSLIDWSGLEMPLDKPIGGRFNIETHEAFLKLPYETASTYGGTSFVRTGDGTASVIDQKYHYDYRPNNSVKNVARNFMNWYGKPSLPWPNNVPRLQGVDYMIHYQNPQIKFK